MNEFRHERFRWSADQLEEALDGTVEANWAWSWPDDVKVAIRRHVAERVETKNPQQAAIAVTAFQYGLEVGLLLASQHPMEHPKDSM